MNTTKLQIIIVSLLMMCSIDVHAQNTGGGTSSPVRQKDREQKLNKVYWESDREIENKAEIEGDKDLERLFDENVVYPYNVYHSRRLVSDIKVVLTFIVEKNGEISEVESCKSIQFSNANGEFEKEILRVFEKLLMEGLHYKPAGIIIDGKPENVRQYVSLEYVFDVGASRKRDYREPAKFSTYISTQVYEGIYAIHEWGRRNYKPKRSRYPERGVIDLAAFVDEKGKLYDIKILNSTNHKFDEDALKLCKKMPKWIPEKVDGVPCKSTYPVFFTFYLEKEGM